METDNQPPLMRPPKPGEGLVVHELIRNCAPLDLNSEYAYHLLCRHFASTCVIAELESRIAGFISGYIKPSDDQTFFVWQVAVSPDFRKRGLGLSMLHWLADQTDCKQFETTISPSNKASQSLFLRFAADRGLNVRRETFIESYETEKGLHEEEILFRFVPGQKLK
ncbi:L-2,4-diaminobutyric acid acetyltransferase [Desulfatibacillum aliphaticivorans]|uniref:L-2,4-diaminobutyric acid acetyltransferase n=2 Tax=Desulfatibacillum aliphaticivorans TaxID=218208 RepID=B8F9D1_DESAL|nr:L-2,4-diaminobutyric acid acetyltransferase [Desulfatibacillum aliphaticivorans]